MIRDNGQAGIILLGQGSATFEDNIIERNGGDLPVGNGAGIRVISGAPSTGSTYFGLNFNRDIVRNNRGDGIELLFDGLAGPPSLTAGIFDHYVRFFDVQVTGQRRPRVRRTQPRVAQDHAGDSQRKRRRPGQRRRLVRLRQRRGRDPTSPTPPPRNRRRT